MLIGKITVPERVEERTYNQITINLPTASGPMMERKAMAVFDTFVFEPSQELCDLIESEMKRCLESQPAKDGQSFEVKVVSINKTPIEPIMPI